MPQGKISASLLENLGRIGGIREKVVDTNWKQELRYDWQVFSAEIPGCQWYWRVQLIRQVAWKGIKWPPQVFDNPSIAQPCRFSFKVEPISRHPEKGSWI